MDKDLSSRLWISAFAIAFLAEAAVFTCYGERGLTIACIACALALQVYRFWRYR